MDEMAEKITTAVAANDWDVQVEPRMILNPTPPSVDIFPGDPSSGDDAAGFGDVSGEELFTVRARVAPTDHEANQDILLEFMDDLGDLSIAAAVLDDPTLNGHASGMHMVSKSGYVLEPKLDGSGFHIGCRWVFMVIRAQS